MDAVTYPDKAVSDFIMEHLIPLRLSHDDTTFAAEYSVLWTPSLLILDNSGSDFHRETGFFEPGEMIAMLLVGMAKVFLSRKKYDAAKLNLDRLLKHYPLSDAVPEAVYFRGVTLYMEKNDPRELKAAFELLQKEYPASSWTKRAAPYRLL